MTADKYQSYWLSNFDWWKYNDKGEAVILPTAPEEAQKSYQYYIEKQQRYDMLAEQAAKIEPD